MASLKQCDRCGRVYNTNNNRHIIKRINLSENYTGIGLISNCRTYSKKYDLCDDCLSDFYEWLTNYKKS